MEFQCVAVFVAFFVNLPKPKWCLLLVNASALSSSPLFKFLDAFFFRCRMKEITTYSIACWLACHRAKEKGYA